MTKILAVIILTIAVAMILVAFVLINENSKSDVQPEYPRYENMTTTVVKKELKEYWAFFFVPIPHTKGLVLGSNNELFLVYEDTYFIIDVGKEYDFKCNMEYSKPLCSVILE